MKGWLIISIFIVTLGASSCNDKLICSAYQSYFVLDNVNYPRQGYPKEQAEGLELNRFDYPDPSYHPIENPIREEYYAYLDSDSFPKMAEVDKDQYGIVKKENLRARERALRMIPMEVVIPQAPDSLLYAGDEQILAELDVVDSAAVDSVRSTVRSYQYNLDQKYYLWYLRNKLVWKDELDKEGETDQEAGPGSEEPGLEGEEGSVEKGNFFDRVKAFFQNLFKKKEPEPDPTVDEPPAEPPAEEENPDGF